ncbi:DUF6221 family protein [Kitasatospora sp. NPDC047058]|uniref:DUF6221 family protein n=1 Tax=Kitasatospora sp. NPDC047058 TaxID=3155620 RepID=UPI0033FD190C
MTADLVAFLRARLDEDERIARRTRQPGYQWRNFDMDGELRDSDNAGTVAYIPHANDRTHIARHDPARVLAEVDAKRHIIDLYEAAHERHLNKAERLSPSAMRRRAGRREALDDTLCLLALPYAGHPDYRPEWAPTQ